MNKLKIFSLLIIVTALVACGDDDIENPYAGVENPITVTEVNRTFDVLGETKGIGVNKQIQSAYSTESWATVSVSANYANVTVTENTGLYNRHANIVIKAAANDSTVVTITQKGIVFDVTGETSFTVDNSSQKLTTEATANTTVNVKSQPSWISTTVADDGTITLNVQANNTGDFRKGYIVLAAGASEKTLSVLQGEASDLTGTYYYAGYDYSSGDLYYLMAQLTYENDSITVSYPDYGWSYTCELQDGMYFDLPSMTEIGTYKEQYVGIVLYSGNVQTTSSKRSFRCQFDYNESEGTIIGEFVDNGSWDGYTVSGITFGLFKASPISSSNYTRKYLIKFTSPFFQKVKDSEESSAKANISPRLMIIE